MPLLNAEQIAELLMIAEHSRNCMECGHRTAQDYCRSCDEFYWLHKPGCGMFENHCGHRLTIVPFVEVRGA